MGVKCLVHYLVFTTDDEVEFYSFIIVNNCLIIGCVTCALDGSSPRGYSQIIFIRV
jgi:hypothetical protein